MLYSILVPSIGGQTKLADMSAAYDALDDKTKEKKTPWAARLYGAKLLDDEFKANPLKTKTK